MHATDGVEAPISNYIKIDDLRDRPAQFMRGNVDVQREWDRVRKSLYCGEFPDEKLPEFCSVWTKHVWWLEWRRVISHAVGGDWVLFRGWLFKLHIMDKEMEAAGCDLSDRASIIYAKWIVDGLREIAEGRFVKLGGDAGWLDGTRMEAAGEHAQDDSAP